MSRGLMGASGTAALMFVLLCATGGCAHTQRIPKLLSYGEDWYPSAARRLHEEGAVLVQFRLDERGRLAAEPRVQVEPGVSSRLQAGAYRVVRGLPRMIDPLNRINPDPKHLYRVTVIFCLEPGTCATIAPFADTVPIMIRAPPIVVSPTVFD